MLRQLDIDPRDIKLWQTQDMLRLPELDVDPRDIKLKHRRETVKQVILWLPELGIDKLEVRHGLHKLIGLHRLLTHKLVGMTVQANKTWSSQTTNTCKMRFWTPARCNVMQCSKNTRAKANAARAAL